MRTLQSQVQLCAQAQRWLGGAMVLAVAAFYVLGYRPMTAKQRALTAELDRTHRQIEANRGQAKARNEIAAKNERLRIELDRIKKPSRRDELPQLVKDLTLAGQQASLSRFAYKPGVSPQRGELFLELPLAVTFEGEFTNVFQFLRTTEEMQRLTRLRNVTMKVKDAKSGQVQAQMLVNIYFALD